MSAHDAADNGLSAVEAAIALSSSIHAEAQGQQQPAAFASRWHELGFSFTLVSALITSEYFFSGFLVVLPGLVVKHDIPLAVQTWPSIFFALATGAFYMPFARLTDMYGAKRVFNGGLGWLLVWTYAMVPKNTCVTLIVFRGLAGVGAAALLPASIKLIRTHLQCMGHKNFVFTGYHAFAPVEFSVGMGLTALTSLDLAWPWYFGTGAMMLFFTLSVGLVFIPRHRRNRAPDGLTMDWQGAILIPLGLILLGYSITASSRASDRWGWPIVTFIVSVCVLAVAVYVEGWVATNPLIPSNLFSIHYTKRLAVGLFFAYGAYGIFLVYSSLYFQLVLEKGPLQTVSWYTPIIISGLVLRLIGRMTLHRFPGRVLLALPGLGLGGACSLLRIMPTDPNYWSFVMPAMVSASIGIDATFTLSNIFITTKLSAWHQGITGPFFHSIFFLGVSVFLGFTNVAVAQTSDLPSSKKYQVAFVLGACLSAVALLIFFFFISAKKLQVR